MAPTRTTTGCKAVMNAGLNHLHQMMLWGGTRPISAFTGTKPMSTLEVVFTHDDVVVTTAFLTATAVRKTQQRVADEPDEAVAGVNDHITRKLPWQL
jgi:hypothetical protein